MATTSSGPNLETNFELVATLLSVLSHSLRTPLSIIKNDLYYLASQVPGGECERANIKIQEIVDLLSISGQLGSGPLEKQVTAISDVLETFPLLQTESYGLKVVADKSRLAFAVGIFRKYCSQLIDQELSCSLQNSSTNLILCLKGSARKELQLQKFQAHKFSSLFKCYLEVAEVEHIELILAELIFNAHAAAIEISIESSLRCCLSIPCAK